MVREASPMNATFDRVRGVVAKEFKIDPSSLTSASNSEGVPGWDSKSHLLLMMVLEEEFGVSFELDEVVELTSIGGIVDALDAKGARK
jgi:acyl carrier protein